MFSSRLTLQGESLSSVRGIKKAPTREVGAVSGKNQISVVKDAEAAAGHPRRHVSAAEAKRIIRVEHRFIPLARLEIVRVFRFGGKIAGQHRMIGRKWEGDNLVK